MWGNNLCGEYSSIEDNLRLNSTEKIKLDTEISNFLTKINQSINSNLETLINEGKSFLKAFEIVIKASDSKGECFVTSYNINYKGLDVLQAYSK
jgi:hypothetical protein